MKNITMMCSKEWAKLKYSCIFRFEEILTNFRNLTLDGESEDNLRVEFSEISGGMYVSGQKENRFN